MRFPEFQKEWVPCCIKDFGTIITGNTPPTKDTDNYIDGTMLWASPTDLGKGKYVYDTITKLTRKGFDKTRKLPKGSVLVTCIGSTIGKMGMSSVEMSTNQQINSIIINSNMDNDFVYHAIERAFPRYLTKVGTQAVPILSKSSFENLPNHFTSKDEQNKIGKLFNLLEERIATQNKIISNLQSLIKGLAEQLTQSGKPNMRLSDCLECHSSTLQESEVSENGSYPVYGATGISGYKDDYAANEDAILIVKDGSGVGTVSFAKGKFSVIGTLNYLTAKGGYSLLYLYYALMAFNFSSFRTGMAIPHIYFKDYGKAKIYCPSIEKQQSIALLLQGIEQKMLVEHEILKQLNTQKAFLLRTMFI